MKDELTKYKAMALIGVIIMGIGSFMSCLAPTGTGRNIGVALLLVSIMIMSYSFYHWQP